MMKYIRRRLAVKFVIILNLSFAGVLPIRASAQADPPTFDLALPFKRCWSYETNGVKNNIASDNVKNVLFSVTGGKILALDFNSGKKIWETDLGGEIISEPVNTGSKDTIYVGVKTLSSSGRNRAEQPTDYTASGNIRVTVILRAIDENTGITKWRTAILKDVPDTDGLSVFVEKEKIYVIGQNGRMSVLNESDGRILREGSLNLGSPVKYSDRQGKNFVILGENKIILADIETGKYVSHRETKTDLTAAYLSDDDNLVLGDKKGELFSVGLNTKKINWRLRFGAQISNISPTSAGLLITSFDNFIYLIAPESGRKIWKRRLDTRLTIRPFLVEEFILVLTLGSPKASVIELNSGKLINQIYLNGDNYFTDGPVSDKYLLAFPTAGGIFAFTNSDNKCPTE